MKKIVATFLSLICLISISFAEQTVQLENGREIILMDDFTWAYVNPDGTFDFSTIINNQIPYFLRGGIDCNEGTILTAIAMYFDGWRYKMPKPRSTQARWGNYDSHTTWYFGYWYNINKDDLFSRSTPEMDTNNEMEGFSYIGDRQRIAGGWSAGGSPDPPTEIEWMLSECGGVKPQ